MLNKEVCIRCCNSCISAIKWRESDERLWKKGKMNCVVTDKTEGEIWIRSEPPEDCPFLLEHMINDDAK